MFNIYLDKAPSFDIKRKGKAHLLIDGTYFHNNLCLVLYYDCDIKYVQLHRLTDRERYEEVKEDLFNLEHLGVQIESITCDGHKAVLKVENYKKSLKHISEINGEDYLNILARLEITNIKSGLFPNKENLSKLKSCSKRYKWEYQRDLFYRYSITLLKDEKINEALEVIEKFISTTYKNSLPQDRVE